MLTVKTVRVLLFSSICLLASSCDQEHDEPMKFSAGLVYDSNTIPEFISIELENHGDVFVCIETSKLNGRGGNIVVDNYNVPSALSTIVPLANSPSTITRNFNIANVQSHSSMSNMMTHTINDKMYDVSRIDAQVEKNSIEIWTFDNTNGKEPHPMHLHGVLFQILSRTGGRSALTPLEKGWKDIALCMPGEIVKIIVQFNSFTGKYVFHCHNLEHEDSGMMGQFQVN